MLPRILSLLSSFESVRERPPLSEFSGSAPENDPLSEHVRLFKSNQVQSLQGRLASCQTSASSADEIYKEITVVDTNASSGGFLTPNIGRR